MTQELRAQIEAALEKSCDAMQMFSDCDAFIPNLRRPSQDEDEHDHARRESVYRTIAEAIDRAREAIALVRSLKEEPIEGENARLTSLLSERDNFIVGEGLWQKFCESLSGRAVKDEPSEAEIEHAARAIDEVRRRNLPMYDPAEEARAALIAARNARQS